MSNFIRRKNMYIALIISLALVCAISVVMIITSICFIVNIIRAYPKPIDSFCSLELSIIFLVVFSIILTASIIGIVFCSFKLKH